MIRAVVDTNLLVAAILSPNGAPADVVRRWLDGEFELVTCPRLLGELRAVLARPSIAPRAPAADVEDFLVVLADGAVVRPDPEIRDAWSRDPDDDVVVELARASGAHVLVTGDLDLLEVRGAMLAIRTPREFLTELAALGPD